MVTFSEDESSEEESSDSDDETRIEDDVQYVDLMLALAEGAARREGVEEGRKQGAVFGAVASFVCLMIFSSSSGPLFQMRTARSLCEHATRASLPLLRGIPFQQ